MFLGGTLCTHLICKRQRHIYVTQGEYVRLHITLVTIECNFGEKEKGKKNEDSNVANWLS